MPQCISRPDTRRTSSPHLTTQHHQQSTTPSRPHHNRFNSINKPDRTPTPNYSPGSPALTTGVPDVSHVQPSPQWSSSEGASCVVGVTRGWVSLSQPPPRTHPASRHVCTKVVAFLWGLGLRSIITVYLSYEVIYEFTILENRCCCCCLRELLVVETIYLRDD
jgi:hypothetical protein